MAASLNAASYTPTVTNLIPDQAAKTTVAFTFQFAENTFNDADGDKLTYTATQDDDTALPAWLSFDADTRTFSGTPQAGDVDMLSVKVTASDGTTSVSDTFELTVAANNAPTVANPIGPQSARTATAFSYTFPANTFNDADGDTLTYTAARVTQSGDAPLPSWLSFTTTASRLIFKGTPQAAQTVKVKVTASDGTSSVFTTFDIMVTKPRPYVVECNTSASLSGRWHVHSKGIGDRTAHSSDSDQSFQSDSDHRFHAFRSPVGAKRRGFAHYGVK